MTYWITKTLTILQKTMINNQTMKTRKLLVITALLLAFNFSFAQTTIDTTQDVIIELFNIKFVTHPLNPGENLLALSKFYRTPLDQIFAYNHFEQNYIKPGTIIRIPIGNFPHKPLIDTIVCCLYKVSRHETLQSIAQKYNISPELIIKFNPEIIKRGLRPRHYIRIPQINFPHDVQDSFFIYHAYKKGETVQLLAILYSIPIEDIQEFNPDSNFQVGKIIVIPKQHYNPQQVSILRADYITLPDFTGLNQIYGQAPPNPPCETYHYSPDSQFNIALILPFYINENYFILPDLKNNKAKNLYDNTKIFYQYFFGTLLALDELKQIGLNINLHIYDSRNSSTKIRNILDRDEMAKMDLIIGPAYSYHYDIVRQYAQLYDVSFVSPFSRKHVVIDSNPNVFLANPSDLKLIYRTAQFLAPVADSMNIVVFYDYDKSQNLADAFVNDVKKISFEQLSVDSVNVRSSYFDLTHPNDYAYLLDKNRMNYVVIPSNNEVFVNGILNFLSAMKSLRYPITVFGMPTWQYFKNFDLKWIIDLNIHFPSAYYLDRSRPEVQKFISKYLDTFHDMPNYYSFLGYDITMFFAHALRQYGKTFRYCLEPYSIEPAKHGIYMNFEFRKDTVYDGFENNAVFMLYYDQKLKLHVIDNIEQTQYLEQKQ